MDNTGRRSLFYAFAKPTLATTPRCGRASCCNQGADVDGQILNGLVLNNPLKASGKHLFNVLAHELESPIVRRCSSSRWATIRTCG